jgi:hypothetical protein
MIENAKVKEEPSGSSFGRSLGSFRLNPSIKRNAQDERLLTGSSFSALKRLCDFGSAGSFPSERLQSAHIY